MGRYPAAAKALRRVNLREHDAKAPPAANTKKILQNILDTTSTKEKGAFEACRQLFRERGLPAAIRSDNGLPCASPNGLYNLSKLSVWWLRLGIAIERIQPGRPQQNGRHERMHLTLKQETTRPAGGNILQRQARFDAFIKEVDDAIWLVSFMHHDLGYIDLE